MVKFYYCRNHKIPSKFLNIKPLRGGKITETF